jgi:hypothetical protein
VNPEAQPPPIPLGGLKTVRRQPAIGAAWRGIWLLTWKPMLAWRRLPLLLLTLLALPCLVYITTATPASWSRRQWILGEPAAQVQQFAWRLGRGPLRLTREQRPQMVQIFSEEFSRIADDLRETESAKPDPKAEAERSARQMEKVKVCYDHIFSRVETVLNQKQYTEFQSFGKRSLLESQGRVSQPRWGRTAPFYKWLADLYFFVILPLGCVRASGALIRDDLQSDTLSFLTTRPLTRVRLLLLKFLAKTAWLQLFALVEALLLLSTGWLRQMPDLGTLLALFLGVQCLAVLAWSALGALFGMLTRHYLALALVYGLIVELGIGNIPTNIHSLSLLRHFKALLAHNPALQGIYGWAGQGVPFSLAAPVIFATAFLAAAALLFTWREYHPATEH